MSELDHGSATLRKLPLWPPLWRKLAVVLWSGFLGAVMLVLALLMGWDVLQAQVDEPGFGLLAAAFAVGWLIASLTAVMALSLALAPQPRLHQTEDD